jgi:hypothetical protein
MSFRPNFYIMTKVLRKKLVNAGDNRSVFSPRPILLTTYTDKYEIYRIYILH